MARSTAYRLIHCLLATLLLLSSVSCISSTDKHYLKLARSFSFTESIISTKDFDLKYYLNEKALQGEQRHLHIYLEGDGRPFINNRYVSKDPTSRKAIALKLMSVDPSPSILLGRPCYHQAPNTRNCEDSKWWTSHRYSDAAIDAMREALSKLIERDQYAEISLIGFSGGGTIAVLLAQQMQDIENLVAINPNLNIHAWTEQHGYSRLSGSINPIELNELPPALNKYFLIGMQDKNIDSSSWISHYEGQANSQIMRLDDYGHSCCWQEYWPIFLKRELP